MSALPKKLNGHGGTEFYFRFLLLIGLVSFLGSQGATAQTIEQPSGTKQTTIPSMVPPVEDNTIFTHILFDQFEGRTNGSDRAFRWDGQGWFGTDTNRLWVKSEGFFDGTRTSDGDVEALYDRPIPRLRYFDFQGGIREDLDSGPHRTWGVLGIEGLAPYFFEFAPTFYFRDGGHVAARITGSYDLRITNRLIAQPELEMNFYNKRDPQRLIGAGLSDLDTGIRVRYEIRRKFAPYIGVAYTRKYGDTAMLSRQVGEAVSAPRIIFGIRVWY